MTNNQQQLLDILRKHNKEVDALCISWEKLEEAHPADVS